jgi:cytochrome c551/c552
VTRPVQFATLVLAAAMSAPGAGQATETQATALMSEHKCYLCHADDAQGTGPAFHEIAARYRSNPDAAGIIAARISRGMRGSGPWHMPPHPELSPDEARAIARYILSLDRQRPSGVASPERPQSAAGAPPRS